MCNININIGYYQMIYQYLYYLLLLILSISGFITFIILILEFAYLLT